jgi:co-chaperonin GroES (HSP10)
MAKNKHAQFGSGDKPLPKLKEMDRVVIDIKTEESNEVKAERQKDKLPQPTGWRLLIVPYSQPRQSAGGIHYSAKAVKDEEIAGVVGRVIALGPLAYQDQHKFNGIPWCKEGDYVIFGRYTGSRIKLFDETSEGLACRLMNDDEILAVVDDPSDYVGLS